MQKKLRFLAFVMLASMAGSIDGCKEDNELPSPVIESFTPTSGVQWDAVTITGTDFSTTAADNIVKFNGVAATVTTSTATSITTTVPIDATTGSITVEIPGRQGTTASGTTFRVDLLFTAQLKGSSESTPNSSTATGTARLVYNKDTKVFTNVTTFSGLTPNNGHIHKGAVGVAGPVIYPFSGVSTSPINYTSGTLTADQEADLIGGLNYVNLHTTTFPSGEIRGQLLKPTTP
jgi:hypothetical protein